MYILLRTNKERKSKNVVFNISCPAVARRCGIISGIAGCSSLPVRRRGCGITVCYLTMPTKDMDFRRRRLHRYNIFAGLLCIFASALMFSGRKEWMICLTISALLQLYTAFVTPKKEN